MKILLLLGSLTPHYKNVIIELTLKEELMFKGKIIILVCLLVIVITPSGRADEDADKTFYPNGQLQSEMPYKDFKPHGIYKYYYQNGDLKEETTYKNGKKKGVDRWFYPNGNFYHERYYKNNLLDGPYKIHYETGQLKQLEFWVNGKRQGEAFVYSKNGQIRKKIIYKNGEKQIAYYYDDTGKLKYETNYKTGRTRKYEKKTTLLDSFHKKKLEEQEEE